MTKLTSSILLCRQILQNLLLLKKVELHEHFYTDSHN